MQQLEPLTSIKMYTVIELYDDSLHFTHRNNATLSDVGGSVKIRQIR